jgi:hypothetical protein
MAISHQSRAVAHWACGHVLEELSQRTRCPGAARLLSVDVVHGRVPARAISTMSRVCHWSSLTSTCRTRSCSRPMTVPASLISAGSSFLNYIAPTGPTRSGMYSSRSPTFPIIKKKPSNVTRFGAIHMGSSSTKPFHCARVRS